MRGEHRRQETIFGDVAPEAQVSERPRRLSALYSYSVCWPKAVIRVFCEQRCLGMRMCDGFSGPIGGRSVGQDDY